MTESLHPQVRALLERVTSGAEVEEITLEEFRRAAYDAIALGGDPIALDEVRDLDLGGVAGRSYRAGKDATSALVVYFHGGGWARGDLDTHDRLCRRLADACGGLLVAVDYPLAPEHPYPAPLDACRTATEWVVAHATDLGADAGRLIVMGDSAGANMAAALTLIARDAGSPPIRLQVLLYPALDATLAAPSMKLFADGPWLTREAMRWCWEQYLGPGASRTDPLVSPLHAPDLAGLPPALIVTASHDPLRDEGERYARRFADAGVEVTCRRYDGMIHSFMLMSGVLEEGRRAIAETGAAVRMALGETTDSEEMTCSKV